MKTNTFDRILLATDGSGPAEAAASVTESFARASGAKVKVLHLWNLELRHRHGVWDVEARIEARALINQTVRRLRAGGVEAEGQITRVDTRHVAAAVAEGARQYQADLVVVGSRGLSDWEALLLHGVSHELLTPIDAPLLIVRCPALAPSLEAQRVLLAIAGEDDLGTTVRAAIAAAGAPGSEVLVFQIAKAIGVGEGFAYLEPAEESQAATRAVMALRESGVTATSMVAPDVPVVQAIVQTATSWQADVIVIGSSRMGDLGSILFGSVTHGLLRATTCPVLLGGRS
jgi:nucleotide-binding universal stress UspA family protein